MASEIEVCAAGTVSTGIPDVLIQEKFKLPTGLLNFRECSKRQYLKFWK
jgi:hypothetical protein